MPEQIIPSDAVKAIQDSVVTVAIALDDANYVTRPVYLPPAGPTVAPLEVHTLTGLIDYLSADADDVVLECQVHIVNQALVDVISKIFGRHRQREMLLSCNCKPLLGNGFQFGSFMSLEQFVINLQSQFVRTENRDLVLRVVGNIREEGGVRTIGDDGVTQSVTAKTGIARLENVEVPNPVILQPYRTFGEIEQPESSFVLRLKPGKDGELPQCALFEADGGAWKLEAIQRIKNYLSDRLHEEIPILA